MVSELEILIYIVPFKKIHKYMAAVIFLHVSAPLAIHYCIFKPLTCTNHLINGLGQERCNSIAKALELHISRTNPS